MPISKPSRQKPYYFSNVPGPDIVSFPYISNTSDLQAAV